MSPTIDLGGRRALVTGGGRGIGAVISRVLAEAGAIVAVNYGHDRAAAEATVGRIRDRTAHDRAFAVRADVADETSVGQMVAAVVERLGGIDILVNNAGTESTVPAIDLTGAEWDRVIGVNLRGAFLCSRDVARAMRDQASGGVIVNNASIHDSVPRLGLVHYCVSKAGLTMLTRALAQEFAKLGIRVVGVAPGIIDTERNSDEIDAIGRDRLVGWVPAARLGEPDDVANLVAFLASDLATYVTGVTVTIDGGYSSNVIRYDPRAARGGSSEST